MVKYFQFLEFHLRTTQMESRESNIEMATPKAVTLMHDFLIEEQVGGSMMSEVNKLKFLNPFLFSLTLTLTLEPNPNSHPNRMGRNSFLIPLSLWEKKTHS